MAGNSARNYRYYNERAFYDIILQYPGIENLRVMTSGPIPPNPIDLLNSPDMSKIIAEMKEQFDLIVLDCPPVILLQILL